MTLIVLGLGWVAGLVAVGAFGAPSWMGAAWALAALPILLRTGILRGKARLGAGAAGMALLGGLTLSTAGHSTPEWGPLIGSDVVLTGTVVSEPDRGDTTAAYTVRVRDVEMAQAADSATPGAGGGRVLVYLHQYAAHLPGDRITVRGKLELAPQFEGFDYRAYLARQGISAVVYRPAIVEWSPGAASPGR
jgi:competence protein ComEC